MILGTGANSESSEKSIKGELESFAGYVKARKTFKDVQTAVYYSRGSENTPDFKEKLREKNSAVNQMIIHSSAKRGKTLLVPFFIGPKFSHRMSLTHWVDEKFKDLDLVYSSEAILPHPNIPIWMKKTANYYTAQKNQVGVVVMPHGATQPYNDAIEKAVAPLRKEYEVEMAYGMGDPVTIKNAVLKLEQKGIRQLVFVRMYSMSDQLKVKTDYILGLRDDLPKGWEGPVPSQVRTSAIINTFGGYEEDTLVAGILLDRIKEVSKNPSKETVILLAHGYKDDLADKALRQNMKTNIEWIQKQVDQPFKKITGMTLREDWPRKREKALEEIKNEIKEGNKSGNVLIISNRLHGSGRYKQFLEKMEFDINEKGLAPHPNLTRWLEKGVARAIKNGFSPSTDKTIVSQNSQIPPAKKVALASW